MPWLEAIQFWVTSKFSATSWVIIWPLLCCGTHHAPHHDREKVAWNTRHDKKCNKETHQHSRLKTPLHGTRETYYVYRKNSSHTLIEVFSDLSTCAVQSSPGAYRNWIHSNDSWRSLPFHEGGASRSSSSSAALLISLVLSVSFGRPKIVPSSRLLMISKPNTASYDKQQ